MSMFGARFAVFVRRARVLPTPCPATRNLSFWRFHRHRHPVVSTGCFTGIGTGWCENSTRWKSHKHVQTRDHGALACLAPVPPVQQRHTDEDIYDTYVQILL